MVTTSMILGLLPLFFTSVWKILQVLVQVNIFQSTEFCAKILPLINALLLNGVCHSGDDVYDFLQIIIRNCPEAGSCISLCVNFLDFYYCSNSLRMYAFKGQMYPLNLPREPSSYSELRHATAAFVIDDTPCLPLSLHQIIDYLPMGNL